ncbi:MAG: hypothetical protein Hyperionvirus4_27 [Hyperionvirus sp.]|uniref:Uncharacterized protein n=1 Tax=Hyperionvirus sp. TaxID=2487770 RepID=A0A3G5A7P3_9VIRU|nr:MAG: hypothetical protein Hyperionvirus4_27 [Hyperionvirus sp.]
MALAVVTGVVLACSGFRYLRMNELRCLDFSGIAQKCWGINGGEFTYINPAKVLGCCALCSILLFVIAIASDKLEKPKLH